MKTLLMAELAYLLVIGVTALVMLNFFSTFLTTLDSAVAVAIHDVIK